MNEMMETVPMSTLIILAVVTYFVGNINPAIIIGKMHHVDIRKEGSGNPGMTNTIRVIGLKAGIAVFVVDLLKAFISVRVGFSIAELDGAMIAFAAVVLGHCFPLIYKFKGGKGVAASLGAALALNWMSAVAALIVAAILFAVTRRMSVASIFAAVSFPFFIWLYEPYCLKFAIGAAIFLVLMHAQNIGRLLRGEEKPLTIGHKGEADSDDEGDGASDTGTAEDEVSDDNGGNAGAADDEAADDAEHPADPSNTAGAAADADQHAYADFADMNGGNEDMDERNHTAAAAQAEPLISEAILASDEDDKETLDPKHEPVDYYENKTIPVLGDRKKSIAVIGSGSFGTAIANLLVYNGHDVTLYGRNSEALHHMKKTRINERYLPYVLLSDRIKYVSSLRHAVIGKNMIVFAVPAQQFRSVSEKCSKYLEDGAVVVNLAKGIEQKTLLRMSEVASETIPAATYVALSGPTHAEEIVRNLPAGVVAVSRNKAAAEMVQDTFMSENFRVYTQDDMVGVEIAGAVKNVIAIATGISDGMKLGSNARAALMTRAIHEIKRLGSALGAYGDTFSGLSGIGDLMVTCSTNLSRNRRCGLLIGLGLEPEEAVKRVGSVVEGYYTAEAVAELADRYSVEMPVCKVTDLVLRGEIPPKEAVGLLMSREKKEELQ